MALPVDVKKGSAVTVFVLSPPGALFTGSAVASFLSPAGVEIEAPSVVASTISTTVASATSKTVMVVNSATGIARGRILEVGGDWGAMRVKVRAVDGTTVTLAEELPAIPTAGDTVVGAEVSAVIAAGSTTTLGMYHRLTVTEAGVGEASVNVAVVDHVFVFPLEEREVRSYVEKHHPSTPLLESAEWSETVTENAHERLRELFVNRGGFPELVWDASVLRRAAWDAVKLELLDDGLVPRGRVTSDYEQYLEQSLDRRVGGVLTGAAAYDADASGGLDGDETAAFFGSIEIRR